METPLIGPAAYSISPSHAITNPENASGLPSPCREGRPLIFNTFDCSAAVALRATDTAVDGVEGAVGSGAEGGDGGNAHHDDEGQHDRVLDRGRAVVALQKLH